MGCRRHPKVKMNTNCVHSTAPSTPPPTALPGAGHPWSAIVVDSVHNLPLTEGEWCPPVADVGAMSADHLEPESEAAHEKEDSEDEEHSPLSPPPTPVPPSSTLLLPPAACERALANEGFLLRQSASALEHAQRMLGNDAARRCRRCWMANGSCFCDQVCAVGLAALLPAGLAKVYLYTHHAEMHRRLATNTGKLLQLAFGEELVERVVQGQPEQEQAMVRELGAVARRQRHTFPCSAIVLLPCTGSWAVDALVAAATTAAEKGGDGGVGQSKGKHPPLVVVVLDGTWHDAKALNRRLDVLLSVFLRGPSQCGEKQSEAAGDLSAAAGCSANCGDSGENLSLLPRVHLRLEDNKSSAVGGGLRKHVQGKRDKVSTAGAFAILLQELAACCGSSGSEDVGAAGEAANVWLAASSRLEAALEAQVNAFREQTLGRSDLKKGLR